MFAKDAAMVRDLFYRPGDYYIIDDITGTKRRASDALLQWDNLLTGPSSFSPRQPQDLVVGVRDDQSVPMPRPRQANQFTVTGTFVTAPAARGATSITVDNITGFAAGSNILIMLDSGENFSVTIAGIVGSSIQWIGAGLPSTVGTLYGDPIENSVILLGSQAVSAGGLMELEDASGFWLWNSTTGIGWG